MSEEESMAIINFGSINIDHVYQVEHFVQPGETLASTHYQKLLGGKGANQSIALAKAGTDIKHVGLINEADFSMKQSLIRAGVDCKYVRGTETPTGHAIIQVADSGENSIILFAGANHELSDDLIRQALDSASPGDWVLMQNETNAIAEIIEQANEQKLKVAFNPAPMTESVKSLPLHKIDLLIVNEVEAEALTGTNELEAMEGWFKQELPDTAVIITLGANGAKLITSSGNTSAEAFAVQAVDTTAAGDTFIGYFLAGYMQESEPAQCIRKACAASAVAVTRVGAAQSIPTLDEVDAFLAEQG